MNSVTSTLSFSIKDTLRLPVNLIKIDSLPKIITGSGPVTPINVALERRHRIKKATTESLDAYARACYLYASFCAHMERSIIDISNDDFTRFKNALLCLPFPNAKGEWVRLIGKRPRGERTADLMLALIYSIAADIEELYSVRFDWRRYGRVSNELIELIQAGKGYHQISGFPRVHRIKWVPRKIVGLPDDQFLRLISSARNRWGEVISDGDLAFAPNQEAQKGALFFRNLAILFVLRYAGSRRREVTLINLEDIRRAESQILLVTKGHGGEFGERLPVILFPFVDKIIWQYVTKYRPQVQDQRKVFLSHSVRNYGDAITSQTVRKIVDLLRINLTPPWNTILTPHMLRHSFGYDMQMHGGSAAVTSGMRHASPGSSKPYIALIEVFTNNILSQVNNEIEELLDRANLLDLIG
jgi:integrase